MEFQSCSYSWTNDLKPHLRRVISLLENVLCQPCRVSSQFKRARGEDCSVPRRELYFFSFTDFRHYHLYHTTSGLCPSSLLYLQHKVCMPYLFFNKFRHGIVVQTTLLKKLGLFKLIIWPLFRYFLPKTMHFLRLATFVRDQNLSNRSSGVQIP